jgi:ABC-2 type transport system ATP-binding protein
MPGRVVILDEPTNDVDPVRRRHLWSQVRAVADEGAAVLLVTHNVLEAERSVDRLGILDHGRVIAEGTPASLKETLSRDLHLELVLEPGLEVPAMATFLERVNVLGHRLVATVPASHAADAAAWAAQLHVDGRIEEFTLAPASLEDAYVQFVDQAAADGQAGGDVVPAGGRVSDVRTE